MQVPASQTFIDEIVASIVCLRNARLGLALGLQSHDHSAVKARIDLCDELISTVGEIGRNLEQLRRMRVSREQTVFISMMTVPRQRLRRHRRRRLS
jgi:hypothetical protein